MRRRRAEDDFGIPPARNAKGQAVDASEYVSHVANVVKARREGTEVPTAPWLVVGRKKGRV